MAGDVIVTRARSSRLKRTLLADAVVVAVAGLLLMVGARPLGALLGLSAAPLRLVGLGLIPYAAFVTYVGTRERIPRLLAWMVIGCNLVWVIGCLLLLGGGWLEPTAPGLALYVAQVVAVALFAWLEYAGLRRERPPAA